MRAGSVRESYTPNLTASAFQNLSNRGVLEHHDAVGLEGQSVAIRQNRTRRNYGESAQS